MTSAQTVVAQQHLSLEYDESVIVCVVKLGMINNHICVVPPITGGAKIVEIIYFHGRLH